MWFYMGIIFNNLSISIYISNSNNVTTNINWILNAILSDCKSGK